jgi:uncharacterized NAD-dependent epimerase/dehydratase family protein
MKANAIVYSENEFGKIDGKVANGLARHSAKYKILGIIDSKKAGLDAGEYLDGIKSGIPVFKSMEETIQKLNLIPDYFIYGIAPLASYLDEKQRQIIFSAMKMGMNIVNGLPEFFTEDDEFVQKAKQFGVRIYDIRKAPLRKYLHNFTGNIYNVRCPVVTVSGTDCAVGKRTTSVKLVEALKMVGLKAIFIATGQTGILQGARYGVAVDVLSSGFATGEVENAVVNAYETEHPDIIVVEGQGALSHPAFTSSSSILRGALPDAIIIQHAPKRINHCDFPLIPMPTLKSEIKLLETFAKSRVIAITINHEDMDDIELENKIIEYEYKYDLPTTDVLKFGCEKIIQKIFESFPILHKAKNLKWQPQD